MPSLNSIERSQLQFYKDMIEFNYPPGKIDLYSGYMGTSVVVDPVYNRHKTEALAKLGLKGMRVNNLNYLDKMQFIFKVLLLSRKFTIMQIFETMDKTEKATQVRFAFQKVLQTIKSGKSKTKRKKTKRKKTKKTKKKKTKRKKTKRKKTKSKRNNKR